MTKFYDYQKILSYGAYLSFIVGGRGFGKSYGAKKLVIDDYIKSKQQFIYLRRYKTELDTAVPEFFSDLANNNEYQSHVFSVKKSKKVSTFYIQEKIVDENGEEKLGEMEVMGYASPLSTSHVLKSTPFPNVRTIIFDEFLLTKGSYHYLRNEMVMFLDFLETVFRMRDNARVFLIANATDLYNPYMSYFDLEMPYNSDFKTFRDGLIVVNYIHEDSKEYVDRKKRTRLGQLIKGTDYEKYSIDNEWLSRANKDFIKKKGGDARCRYVFYYDKEKYGLWVDTGQRMVYVSKDHDPLVRNEFAFDLMSHTPETIYRKLRTNMCYIALVTAFENGYLYFESLTIKEKIMRLIDKMES